MSQSIGDNNNNQNNNEALNAVFETKQKKHRFPLISKYVDEFAENERNAHLEELLFSLEAYKKEKQSQPFQQRQENTFRDTLFIALERLIIECVYLSNPVIRKKKIFKIYKWYKDKIESIKSITAFKERSYYEVGEIQDPEPSIPEKDHRAIEKDLDINEHRENIVKLRDWLQYEVKHVKKEDFIVDNNNYDEEEELKDNVNLNVSQKRMEKTGRMPMLDTGLNLVSPTTTYYSSMNGTKMFAKVRENAQHDDSLYKYSTKAYSKGAVNDKGKLTWKQMIENNNNIIPNMEIKSSYSFNRPEFTFNVLDIESKLLEQKNKILLEKRNEEEVVKAVDEFGSKRAMFKEQMNKKFELKKIIDYYTEIIPPVNMKLKNLRTIDGEESPRKKKKLTNKKEDDKRNLNVKDNNNQIKNKQPQDKDSNQVQDLYKESSLIKRTSTINNPSINLNEMNSVSNRIQSKKTTNFESNLPGKRNPYMRRSTRLLNHSKSSKIFQKANDTNNVRSKVTTSNYKNKNKNNELYAFENEKQFTVHMKLDPTSNKPNLIKQLKDISAGMKSDLQADCVANSIMFSPIYKARLLQKHIWNVKEIDQEMNGYAVHYLPLSGFDTTKSHFINSEEKKLERSNSYFNSTQSSKNWGGKRITYWKDNYKIINGNMWDWRKTMGLFKGGELIRFNKSTNNNSRNKVSKSSVIEAFSWPSEKGYLPHCFLPKSGSGLWIKPIEMK